MGNVPVKKTPAKKTPAKKTFELISATANKFNEFIKSAQYHTVLNWNSLITY